MSASARPREPLDHLSETQPRRMGPSTTIPRKEMPSSDGGQLANGTMSGSARAGTVRNAFGQE